LRLPPPVVVSAAPRVRPSRAGHVVGQRRRHGGGRAAAWAVGRARQCLQRSHATPPARRAAPTGASSAVPTPTHTHVTSTKAAAAPL